MTENKPAFTVEQAEYLRHTIGNNIFALETTLHALRNHVTEANQLSDVEAMTTSLESMKERLAELEKP